MDAHGGKPQGDKEEIESLQKEYDKLKEQLETESDDKERESLEIRIGDIYAKLEILRVSQEEVTFTSKQDGIRKSTRERTLTPKMQELKLQEVSKMESKFEAIYEAWKGRVRAVCVSLKLKCSDSELCEMIDYVTTIEGKLKDAYNNIRAQSTPSTEIRRKIDGCVDLTRDLMELLKLRQEELGLEFNAEAEMARLNALFDKEYAQSLVSTTFTVGKQHSKHGSEHPSVSEKIADCAAELAAKQAEIQMEDAIAAQKQYMAAQQQELAAQQQAMVADMAAKQQAMAAELKRLENQRDIQVLTAKLKAYSEADSGEGWDERSLHSKVVISHPIPKREIKFESKKEIKSERTCKDNVQSNSNINEMSLVQALHDTMVLTRLPAPEPSIFTGDPLNFIEWSTSFKALIERRCTNTADRLFYLQKYIGGEARSVLEGSFFRKDEEAYDQAWEALNERYGHSFIIERAFRDKLKNWPKIGPREPFKLRQFGDFLKACSNAMPHVKGLQALDDCEKNQEMLQKLPDWVTSRWNRIVSKCLKENEDFPGLKEFAEFIAEEAYIACNPISSLYALKHTEERQSRDIKHPKANVLATNTIIRDKPKAAAKMRSEESSSEETSEDEEVKTSPATVKCICCGESHFIYKCKTFCDKSVEDKKRFIFDNNLCFGCPRRGHKSKECKKKATCNICKKQHPTPLHEDSSVEDEASSQVEQEESTSSLSCYVDRGYGGSTSMIVPVWLSSTTAPESKTLVYALLDTQSSSTFVDREVCKKMGAVMDPVKLKLTTMMGKDSIVKSEKVSGLTVRGVDSDIYVNLPPAYTREFIPHDCSQIPTAETARRWKHLEGIAYEMSERINVRVGLLIGYDCSKALAPRRVITGGDYEPYAIKTDLGWSIVGGIPKKEKSTDVTAQCHQISVKELLPRTATTVIRALETENNGETKDNKDSENSSDISPTAFSLEEEIKVSREETHHTYKTVPESEAKKKCKMQIHTNKNTNEESGKERLHLKFKLNNKELESESRPRSERTSGVPDVDHDELLTQTVLGVKQSVNGDTFSLKITLDSKPETQYGTLTALFPFLEMCQRGIG